MSIQLYNVSYKIDREVVKIWSEQCINSDRRYSSCSQGNGPSEFAANNDNILFNRHLVAHWLLSMCYCVFFPLLAWCQSLNRKNEIIMVRWSSDVNRHDCAHLSLPLSVYIEPAFLGRFYFFKFVAHCSWIHLESF